MKDYTLSEQKAICMKYANVGCRKCEIFDFCTHVKYKRPYAYDDIEPRDMIELPCKEQYVHKHDDGHVTEIWRVFYREDFMLVGTAFFQTEPEADAFLAELKGEKHGN